MCFEINKKNPNSLIATENIVCYKIVNKDLTSLYTDFQYEIGKIYKMEKNLKLEMNIVINCDYGGSIEKSLVINEGFHSYIDKISNFNKDNKVSWELLECVIPKGSTYYINTDNCEYVSNKIKINKIKINYFNNY